MSLIDDCESSTIVKIQAVVRGMLCRARLSVGPALVRVVDANSLYQLAVYRDPLSPLLMSELPPHPTYMSLQQTLPAPASTTVGADSETEQPESFVTATVSCRTWSYSGAVTSLSIAVYGPNADANAVPVQTGKLLLPTVFAAPRMSIRAKPCDISDGRDLAQPRG